MRFRDVSARAARTVSALAASALFVVAALSITAGAQVDRSQQQRLQDELSTGQRMLEQRRAEIAAITRELGETDAELRARVRERDAVSEQLRDLERRRTELLATLAAVEAERGRTAARVSALEGDLALMQERVQALLVNLHRTRAGRIGGVLGRAESFHDLRVKQHFIGLLAEQDVAVVTELDAVITNLEGERALLEAQIETLREGQAELERNALALDGTRVRLATMIAQLESTQAGQRAQERSILEAQEALEAQLRRIDADLAREIARLEAEERRLREEAQRFVQDRQRSTALEDQADQTRARIDNLRDPAPSPAAGYVAPLDASVVTVRFNTENNSFVVLRASEQGAAVRAVRGGTVLSVADLGANEGHMVAVRHDATLTTVYTNLRPPVVQSGDRVEAGTVIGYLGGSSLVAPDILRFYLRRTVVGEGGRESSTFVDPAPVLGL
jgi:murein DD-endopeptidase MepM/ murein hydrolase activator NlpD